MTTHPFTSPDELGEPLAEGGTWLLDLVAAVDHLRRGHRPGLTVWDALEEALRWRLPRVDTEPSWDEPDPLADTLRDFLDHGGTPVAHEVQAAVRDWVTAAADRYNRGCCWPHPRPRRGFPPPLLFATEDDDG